MSTNPANPCFATIAMSLVSALAAFAVLMLCAGAGHAMPQRLTADQFREQTTGSPGIVETFDGYAVGDYPSPFRFSNGTITGRFGFQIDAGGWCYAGPCLTIGLFDVMIDGFPPGTTHWSTHVIEASGEPTQTLAFHVLGRDGTTLVTTLRPDTPWTPLGTFIGFADPRGIESVLIRNLGTSQGLWTNRSLADVTTAAVGGDAAASPVPTLTSLGLALLAGLVALGGRLAVSRHSPRS